MMSIFAIGYINFADFWLTLAFLSKKTGRKRFGKQLTPLGLI